MPLPRVSRPSRRLLVTLASAWLLSACQNTPTASTDTVGLLADRAGPEPGTHRQYGTPIKLGNGMARSYIILNGGIPLELGVALSEKALDGLPAPSAGPGPDEHSYLLPLPASNPTQFQLVELDWNPGGHPPPMVYTVPHFDFHFYVIGLDERNAILPSDPAWATKAANFPSLAYRPAGYIPPPIGTPGENAVPQMGLHWINPASPEFHGTPFTRTFIFGSWDGKFIFYEPMITRAYLLSRPDEVASIPVAAQHDPSGYYPGAYRVTWDGKQKEWRIAITGLSHYQ